MRQTITLPKLGDATDEVLVLEWVAQVGDQLGEGDTLFTAETDKVEADVPCPVTGMLVEQLVQADEEVATGAPIAVIEA